MNIQEQVIDYLVKKAKQDKDFAGATSKQMAKTIPYKMKSIETQCLLLEHAGLIFRTQEDETVSPNVWQKREGVTVDTLKTGELTMNSQPGETQTTPAATPAESQDLDQKAMFIDHLTKIGVAPKNAIPTIADIFFTGDIDKLTWLNQVLQREAAGFVNPSQRRLIVSWWSHTRGLPYEEEDFFPESEEEEKNRKGPGKRKPEEGKPAKPLDLGVGWKVGKDNAGDWVAQPGGAMTYQEAVEAAERRHLISVYQTPRGDDSGDNDGDGEGLKTTRKGGKREEPLVEKMMMKVLESFLDGGKGRDSAGDERVERLQEQINRMQEERLEDRFERLEGLVAQAASRDPWDEYDRINQMKERLGIGGPAVTDQSPAVQIIKDSSDKMDKNIGRMVGIMERYILREGDFKPEETRSAGEREQKADELLVTAQSRERSRGIRKNAFGH